MTDFATTAYDNLISDLVNGQFTPSTGINAALLQPSYVLDKTHTTMSSINAFEASGTGYARFTGVGVFSVAAVGDTIQYQTLTPAVSFAPFTATWRYVVLYNATNDNLYLCMDSGQTINQGGTGFGLDNGSDPYLTVTAP